MTQEEKAKRYDEALGKARRYYDEYKTRDNILYVEDMEDMFPELKESEESKDDKIVKHLITLFKNEYGENSNARFAGIKVKDIISWLEKQGEHANFINKIQIGDKVTRNQDGVLVNLSQLNRVAKKQSEQKPVDKVEPKFKVWDEIRTKNEESLTITRIDRWGYWSEDLFICNFDDADKWELVEQKPTAWSEEDEKRINRLIAYFEGKESFTAEDDIVYANWLKSLRPQSLWKPSDE